MKVYHNIPLIFIFTETHLSLNKQIDIIQLSIPDQTDWDKIIKAKPDP